MYFNKNNVCSGVIFSHFHDDKMHKKNLGSINQGEFSKIINFVRKKYFRCQYFF